VAGRTLRRGQIRLIDAALLVSVCDQVRVFERDMETAMYDVIGDLHGHADELLQLLRLLGYERSQGTHRHPERKVIFLGDFIDRGPEIRETLRIVRAMVDDGHALAVLGNHELNALAYHTENPHFPGEYLRRRSEKNTAQHSRTLEQLSSQELQSALAWFRKLPMWLEFDDLRAVHACWDDRAIAKIGHARKGSDLCPALLHSACHKDGPLFGAGEVILKGKEGRLPSGTTFQDKDGQIRSQIRTRWYLPPAGHTYRTYALQSAEIVCDVALDMSVVQAATPYPESAKPVFVGHYWLTGRRPELLAPNVACLDYSVAKGGFLCAYRWNGEQILSNENFVWVQ
jgi:hypothetical protein